MQTNVTQTGIEKLKAAYDELVRLALQNDTPSQVLTGLSQIRNAAAFLRQKGNRETKISYRTLAEARKGLRAALRQKIVTSTPGFRDKGEFYYHTRFNVDFVQNYLDVQIVDRIEVIPERRINNITGASGLVNEGDSKPVLEPSVGTSISTFTKIAFTSILTEETLYANPALLDYWIFYATQRLEFDLHNILSNAVAGNAVVITPPSLGLPQPRFIDLVEYLRQLYNLNAPEGLDIPDWEAVAVILPQPYWLARNIQQDSTGQARSTEVISDLALIPRGTNTSDPTVVFGKYDLVVYILDGVMIYFDRIIEQNDDRNFYRFTAELYYAAMPRTQVSRRVNNTQTAINSLI